MQRAFFLAIGLLWFNLLSAQHIGIGTPVPLARLHIDSGALLVTGTTGSVPFNGAGTRFMWVPVKSALRFGQLDNSASANWHIDSIGYYSLAAGKNAKAKGDSASVALGWNVSASGKFGSIALGSWSEASGDNSVSIGTGSKASGLSGTAMGFNDTASGDYATAIGLSAHASGLFSTAIGVSAKSTQNLSLAVGLATQATNLGSMSIGARSLSNGVYSITVGDLDTALADNSIAVGVNNKVTAPYAKAFGSGIRVGGASSLGVGDQVVANGYFSQAYGNLSASLQQQSFVFGNYDTSANEYSFALGNSSYSGGAYSWAQGNWSRAMGAFSFAIGTQNRALGNWSYILGSGNTTEGSNAISIGNNSYAKAVYSVTLGTNLSQKSYGGFAAGMYNDTTDAGFTGSVSGANRIFQVGNGTADNARGNALTLLQNGNLGLGVLLPETLLHIRGQGSNNQVLLENSATGSQIRLSDDGGASGPYIGTVSNHDFALVSNNAVRAVITSAGQLNVASNITVQNGKGLIRGIDGIQKKQLTATVTINAAFAAGQTRTFAVVWPEAFTAAPDAFVGNIQSGAGGWAEVVMTISNSNNLGATLYVYNPKTTAVSPNFTVRIIAIGAQ